MLLYKAETSMFCEIKNFYHELIDLMSNQSDLIGWKKGIYPSDEYIIQSLKNGELYIFKKDGKIAASVILNSSFNEGYIGVPWGINCEPYEVLIPHALAVHPNLQRQKLGKSIVKDIFALAQNKNKKAVRLDILGTNIPAEKLYLSMGFKFVAAKNMFYEDTGLTEYKMYEYVF